MDDIIRWRNTKISALEETIKGTPEIETPQAAILLGGDGAAFNLDRESLENPIMTASFSKLRPYPGMNSPDLGPTIPTVMRGKGTLSKGTPEWAVFAKSLFGLEHTNTDGVCAIGCTTTDIQVGSGADDLVLGQQVYFPNQAAISTVRSLGTGEFTVWPSLPSTPADTDPIIAGTSWQLSSDVHPALTLWSYFNGAVNPLRLQYSGTQCINGVLNFTVGQFATMLFQCRAVAPDLTYIAQSVTPEYDTVTPPLRCLAADAYSLVEGLTTGTPTTTETILATPPFDVRINDFLHADVGSNVWETVKITAVSGTAGTNITLTHDPLSTAASTGAAVFVERKRCAMNGNSVEITVALPTEQETCMEASYGISGLIASDRNVTLTKTPYFRSWEAFLMRDAVVAAAMQITLSDGLGNIVSVNVPAEVNIAPTITTDALMAMSNSSMATIDPVLGFESELVISSF